MKTWVFIVAMLSITGSGFSQTARSYFDELYKVGGLDRMADEYVCFGDEPTLDTFFIFGRSDTLKQFLSDVGGYAKLPAKQKALLNKGFLTVRLYDKGVPLSAEDTYIKDEDSWVGDVGYLNKQTPMRMRLEISWQTLRYKRSVQILHPNLTLRSQESRYGRCEIIPSGVQQTAN